MNEARTIRQILDAAGGFKKVSEAIGYDRLSSDAVRKWPQSGIPDRYWSVIIKLAGSSAAELFDANETVRAGKAA